jgi:hypothetical protein
MENYSFFWKKLIIDPILFSEIVISHSWVLSLMLAVFKRALERLQVIPNLA